MNMEAIQDFEDMLHFLDKHKVRYLIIGGLAFIYHAKPRYTKDMDLWIDSMLRLTGSISFYILAEQDLRQPGKSASKATTEALKPIG